MASFIDEEKRLMQERKDSKQARLLSELSGIYQLPPVSSQLVPGVNNNNNNAETTFVTSVSHQSDVFVESPSKSGIIG